VVLLEILRLSGECILITPVGKSIPQTAFGVNGRRTPDTENYKFLIFDLFFEGWESRR
jgi:hypothetical protein